MSANLKIKDNDFLRQYEYHREDDLAVIEYSEQDRKIFLTRLHVPEPLDNKEFKNDFIRAVFNEIRDHKNVKIVPNHPIITGFVRRNRQEYKDLLPVGINL